MARFRATIKGQRGGASRLGGVKSGVSAHINGWDSGVEVQGSVVEGADEFSLYMTGGSGRRVVGRYLGRIILADGVPVFVPAAEEKWESAENDPALDAIAADLEAKDAAEVEK